MGQIGMWVVRARGREGEKVEQGEEIVSEWGMVSRVEALWDRGKDGDLE